jgi:hypothetical protein
MPPAGPRRAGVSDGRGAAPDPAREPFEKGSLDPPKLFGCLRQGRADAGEGRLCCWGGDFVRWSWQRAGRRCPEGFAPNVHGPRRAARRDPFGTVANAAGKRGRDPLKRPCGVFLLPKLRRSSRAQPFPKNNPRFRTEKTAYFFSRRSTPFHPFFLPEIAHRHGGRRPAAAFAAGDTRSLEESREPFSKGSLAGPGQRPGLPEEAAGGLP